MPPQHDGRQDALEALYPMMRVSGGGYAKQEVTTCLLRSERMVLEEQEIGGQLFKVAVNRCASDDPPVISLH